MYKILTVGESERIKSLVQWDKFGFEICAAAANGDEAVECAKKYKPDVILIDALMSTYNSIELAGILREKDFDNEIVIISEYTETKYLRDAIKYGVRYYFNYSAADSELEQMLASVKERLDKNLMLDAGYWDDIELDKNDIERIKDEEKVDFANVMNIVDSVMGCIRNGDAEGVESLIDEVIKYAICCNESLCVMSIFISVLETRLLYILPDDYESQIEICMDHELSIDESVSEFKPMLYATCIRAIDILYENDSLSNTNIDAIKKYLRDHYKEDIKIKQLSKIFYISTVYLGALFSRKVGVSIKVYVHMLRMQEVKRLIKESDMSFKDIAYEVGYNNYNNFFAWFEKVFGTTPEEYRKSINEAGGK